MLGIIDIFRSSKELQPVIDGIETGKTEQLVTGLTSSAKSIFVASTYKQLQRSIVVVAHNLYQSQKMYDDLVHILGEQAVWMYPVNDLTAAEMSIASPELRAERIEVMKRLVREEKGVYILPV
ncbi:MAG: transcription-repair coupling factor, partial [Bacilli bacterium]